MTDQLFVQHIPCISTTHLPGEDAIEDLGVLFAKYEYGFFVWLDEDEVEPWFVVLRNHIKSLGDYSWVRFDADADVIEGLPTFDW